MTSQAEDSLSLSLWLFSSPHFKDKQNPCHVKLITGRVTAQLEDKRKEWSAAARGEFQGLHVGGWCGPARVGGKAGEYTVSERTESSPNSLLWLSVVVVRCEHIALNVWLFASVFSFAIKASLVCAGSPSLNLEHQSKRHSEGELKGTFLASKAIKAADEGSRESQKFWARCRRLQRLQIMSQECITTRD